MLIFFKILEGGNPRVPPLNETLKMGHALYMHVHYIYGYLLVVAQQPGKSFYWYIHQHASQQ